MSYSPPFSITPEILNLVAAISEQVGVLKADAFSASPQLRKQNRIKTITGTLAIEGITFTEEQVTAVLDGKPVLGSVRELAEVKGAIKAYEALPYLKPDQLDHLLEAHALMMSDLLAHAGAFRTQAVGIHKGEEVHHIAPPAHRVSGLMADLMQWIASAKVHPLIVSSVFHYEFEFIHPFMDGNGRLGRLWQTLILSKWRPLFLALPLESVIKDNQENYYRALEEADKLAESTPFIHFMLSVIQQTLAQNALVNASIDAPVNLAALKTPQAVLRLVEENPAITRQEMAERIGKDLRTIGRAIAKLRQAEKLRRIGSDKDGHWEITDDE